MAPLVDLHCHLLAGLDDGPRTQGDALAMCRMASAEGTHAVLAVAHQNERWPTVTPHRIRQACQQLAACLREEQIPLAVIPGAEVMVHVDVIASWKKGELLSAADRGKYLLIEMPDGLFVDLRDTIAGLRAAGVRPILAHPERHPELLHGDRGIGQLIEAGCLVQVSSDSITNPANRRDERALKHWVRQGVMHVLGSDGHSARRRPPRMAAAYERVRSWAGDAVADRVCRSNGMAILYDLPLHIEQPRPKRRTWFARVW